MKKKHKLIGSKKQQLTTAMMKINITAEKKINTSEKKYTGREPVSISVRLRRKRSSYPWTSEPAVYNAGTLIQVYTRIRCSGPNKALIQVTSRIEMTAIY